MACGAADFRAARDSAAAAACSTVRFRPWGALTVSQVPQHVPLPPPTTLRPLTAMLAAQRATLHGAPRALALGPCRSRQPPTRHSQACWSAPGRALCAAIPAAHTCTIAGIFVRLGTALAAAGGGAGAPRSSSCPEASTYNASAPWCDSVLVRICAPRASPARTAPAHARWHQRPSR